ncbi:MAG: NERD domain-containing protein [Planctomycetales bacterium]|nr:NERD domain-containing protein [Planctomycetales bacterium]MCA9143831.1 NERD domain-containing protein [Planctomycetales bacterium]
MILKEKSSLSPTDKFGQAGYQAEMQMAFYLRRAFGELPDVYVFNDLRFVRNGEVAQIDHLVLHRFGLVLIESKSVTGTIEVNRQLEFVRTFGRNRSGMKSPITQVEMQKELLQALLNDHKEQLRRKVMMGMVQAQFSDERFKTFVAISDKGEIKRRGCDPPQLVKADRVTAEIQQIIDRHTKASGFGGIMRQVLADKKTAKELEQNLLRAFTNDEMNEITAFLLRQQTDVQATVEPPPILAAVAPGPAPPPLPQPPAFTPPPPVIQASSASTAYACRHCSGQDIEILYGQYGYYFKCRSCSQNTPIDFKCESCGKKAKISKSGKVFTRKCGSCNAESFFFTNPE